MSTLHRFFASALLTATLPLGAGCIAASEAPVDQSDKTVADDEEEVWDESDASLVSAGEVGEIIYDGPGRPTFTRCENDNTTHCCPSGFAMVGIHTGDNVFRCVRTIKPANIGRQWCTFDAGTADWVYANQTGSIMALNMHVCPNGRYMRGANLGSNRFLCCADTANTSGVPRMLERYSTDPLGYMRACGEPYWSSSVSVMTGYHGGQNALSCSSYPNYL